MTVKCEYCGGQKILDVFECWEHEFMLETCCEGLYQEACDILASDGNAGVDLLRSIGTEDLLGGKLRRVCDQGAGLLLDWQLRVTTVSFKCAREFVRRHHAHCPPPAGWRWGHAIWNGWTLVGVAMIGRPVARALDASTTVEVNRLCLDWALPAPLRWNAASMLYGAAAREAQRRGFSSIITYTLESECGVSLKAAGWVNDARTRGGSWSRSSRPRIDRSPIEGKLRWRRALKPKKRESASSQPIIWINHPERGVA